MSHPGYLHVPLQMLGPENGVCNYLALESIYGMLILRIHAFLPPEIIISLGREGGRGGGSQAPQDPHSPSYAPELHTKFQSIHCYYYRFNYNNSFTLFSKLL